MSCKCPTDCCSAVASDMTAGERMPIFIDVSAWLESVNSRTIASTNWVSSAINAEKGSLDITHMKEDNGNYQISANISGGCAGVKYRVDVLVETCEGHRGRFCFTQYVRDC